MMIPSNFVPMNKNNCRQPTKNRPRSVEAPSPTSIDSASGISTDFLRSSRYQVNFSEEITGCARKHQSVATMPSTYKPTDYDVVCGRGKGSYSRPGNRRFRDIVTNHVREYLETRNKFDKGLILEKIVDQVHEQQEARFIKRSNGRWYEIGHDMAREKAGHVMREMIAAMDIGESKHPFLTKQSELLTKQQGIFNSLRKTSSESKANL